MTTIFFDNGQCLQTATSVKDLWIMLRDMQKANEDVSCRIVEKFIQGRES